MNLRHFTLRLKYHSITRKADFIRKLPNIFGRILLYHCRRQHQKKERERVEERLKSGLTMTSHKSVDACTKRVIRLIVTVFFLVVLFVPSMVNSSISSSSPSTSSIQYCSFFSNRAPSPQPGLKNCTWFKSNSCCLQEEISATFGRVKPLPGADKNCQNFLNYLMCYICAPDQNTFYLRERLTVCREFCNNFYEACRTAVLKGSIIGDLYSNGSQFCLSRSFKVDDAANGHCFNHAIQEKTSGAVTLQTFCMFGTSPPFFIFLLICFVSWVMALEPPPLVWERWSLGA